MVYGYCRVSSKNQLDGNGLEVQRNEIIDRYCDAKIISEQFTGKTTERPIFSSMIDNLNSGDTLVTSKLDRFCRSTKEGLELIDILMKKGVRIHIVNMGLIEDTPMGKLIVTNLLAFAEFERSLILERTLAGKKQAKATDLNWKEGRPKKYTNEQLNNAMDMLQENSYNKVARITGLSKSTLIREKRNRGLIPVEISS